MQTVSSKGRSFVNGKALSKELRTLIVDKIISEGGNPLTGEFTNSSCSEIGRSVRVCHATVAKIWKQFCETRSISPNRNYRGRPCHLSYGDLCLIETLKREKPTISYDEVLQHLYEFGDLPFGTVSKSAISKAVQHRLPSGKFTLKKVGVLHRKDSLYKIWRTHNFFRIIYIKKIRKKLSSLTSAA